MERGLEISHRKESFFERINSLIITTLNSIFLGKATVYSKSQLYSHALQDLCIDFFIYRAKGVLHIGAFDGKQFARHYSDFGKPVIWIEANDSIFPVLKKHIEVFPNQRAFNLLLGSKNCESEFYEFTNLGSSSIYPINKQNPWDLSFKTLRRLRMSTLAKNFTEQDLLDFDFWVIDTQGAELEVLKGAGKLLQNCCRWLYVEVSNNTEFQGGAEFTEVSRFLSEHGFVAAWEFSGFHGDVLFINSMKLG